MLKETNKCASVNHSKGDGDREGERANVSNTVDTHKMAHLRLSFPPTYRFVAWKNHTIFYHVNVIQLKHMLKVMIDSMGFLWIKKERMKDREKKIFTEI